MNTIPLFPLRHALFPAGVLHLQVFEVRYLHMVRRCLEEGAAFGVVGLIAGNEVRTPEGVEVLANAGTLARIEQAETVMPGLMRIRCVGTTRFRLASSYQGKFGLWMGEVEFLPDDPEMSIPAAYQRDADFLGRIIADLQRRGSAALPIAPLPAGRQCVGGEPPVRTAALAHGAEAGADVHVGPYPAAGVDRPLAGGAGGLPAGVAAVGASGRAMSGDQWRDGQRPSV